MATPGTTQYLARYGNVKYPKHDTFDSLTDNLSKSVDRPIGGVHMYRLRKPTAFMWSLFYSFCLILAFSITWYQLYLGQYKTQFLSPIKNDPGGDCIEIPDVLNGAYESSIEGYWETDPRFNKNRSAFHLEFTGAELSQKGFHTHMKNIAKELADLGKKFASRNTFMNLLVWATYVYNAHGINFYSTADAEFIFDMQIATAFVTSIDGPCSWFPNRRFSARYDRALQRLTMMYPVPGGVNDTTKQPIQTCPNQGNWISKNGDGLSESLSQFNWKEGAQFTFDIRTTLLTISLNLGIVKLETLQQIRSEITYAFGLIAYIDPTYTPAMTPIYCLDKSRVFQVYGIRLTQAQMNGPPICFLVDSFRSRDLHYFYPWANQLFFDESRPLYQVPVDRNNPSGLFESQQACSCPANAKSIRCNAMESIYISYFYDTSFQDNNTVAFALKMLDVYLNAGSDGDLAVLNRLTRLVSLSDSIVGTSGSSFSSYLTQPVTSFTSSVSGARFDNSWANNLNVHQLAAREFRDVCPTCSAIVFNMQRRVARTDFTFVMNEYGLSMFDLVQGDRNADNTFVYNDSRYLRPQEIQALRNTKLPYIMCTDTLSQRRALAKMTLSPPVDLSHSYYNCHKTWQAAAYTTMGSAAAMSNIIIIFWWAILGLCFKAFYHQCNKSDEGEIYPSEGKLRRMELAERDVERFALIEVIESLRGVADEIESKGGGSNNKQASSAASELRDSINNYTQLFKPRGRPGEVNEETVSQARELGELITRRIFEVEEAEIRAQDSRSFGLGGAEHEKTEGSFHESFQGDVNPHWDHPTPAAPVVSVGANSRRITLKFPSSSDGDQFGGGGSAPGMDDDLVSVASARSQQTNNTQSHHAPRSPPRPTTITRTQPQPQSHTQSQTQSQSQPPGAQLPPPIMSAHPLVAGGSTTAAVALSPAQRLHQARQSLSVAHTQKL